MWEKLKLRGENVVKVEKVKKRRGEKNKAYLPIAGFQEIRIKSDVKQYPIRANIRYSSR